MHFLEADVGFMGKGDEDEDEKLLWVDLDLAMAELGAWSCGICRHWQWRV